VHIGKNSVADVFPWHPVVRYAADVLEKGPMYREADFVAHAVVNHSVAGLVADELDEDFLHFCFGSTDPSALCMVFLGVGSVLEIHHEMGFGFYQENVHCEDLVQCVARHYVDLGPGFVVELKVEQFVGDVEESHAHGCVVEAQLPWFVLHHGSLL
jgi:hypothetical protein